MSVTIGTSIIWGISSSNLTGFSAAVSGAYTISEESLEKTSDVEEIRDSQGEVKTLYFYSGKRTLSIKCFPSGSSASAVALPGAGDVVTVTSTDSDISGNWACLSASKARKSDGIVEFDISLINHDGITE